MPKPKTISGLIRQQPALVNEAFYVLKQFLAFIDAEVSAHQDDPPKIEWDKGYEAACVRVQGEFIRLMATAHEVVSGRPGKAA